VSRFYFDIRDRELLVRTKKAWISQRAAEIEAALSLADVASQLTPFASSEDLAIEVRDAAGPVLKATFVRLRGHPIN
jgi:hypothetical protein